MVLLFQRGTRDRRTGYVPRAGARCYAEYRTQHTIHRNLISRVFEPVPAPFPQLCATAQIKIRSPSEGSESPIFFDTSSVDWEDSDRGSDGGSSASSIFIDSPQEAPSGEVLRYPQPDDVSTEQQRQQRQPLALEEWIREEKELDRLGAEAWCDILGEPAPTAPPDESRLPFTDTIRRGDVCAFIPAYVHQRAFAEATVDSILRLMPGIRVAIAADPSEIEDYRRWVGVGG